MSRFVKVHGLMAAALALTLFGCSTEGTVSGNNDPVDQNNPPGDVPQGSTLEHVDDCEGRAVCAYQLNTNGGRLLKARVVNPQGQPVRGATVAFALNANDTPGTTLEAANAVTGPEGVAQVTLKSGNTSGVANVKATLAENPNTELNYTISINPKGASSYDIAFNHIGGAELRKVKALLYSSDVTCDAIRADLAKERDEDPATTASLTAEWVIDGQADAAGNLPILQQAAVPNGTAYTVAAFAYWRENDQVEMAFGCKDENPAVSGGTAVQVTVDLKDHFPDVVGVYDVNHSFDLRDGLPPTVRVVVDLIGKLTTNPGEFLVGCDPNNDECGSPDGLIQLLLDLDFIPQNIKDTINDVIGNPLIRATITDLLNNALLDASWLPSWAKGGIDVTADIYNTLKEFRVVGIVRLNEAPMVTDDGTTAVLPVDSGEQVWSDIIVYWKRGCTEADGPTCGERSLLSQLPQDQASVTGTFDGSVSVADGYQLTINEHPLSLNYGVLLMGVVEKIALPAIFGQDVDSVDKLIAKLVTGDANTSPCTKVATAVDSDPNANLHKIALRFCDQILLSASDRLREYVTNSLVADGAETFLIGTPQDAPCTMGLAEAGAYQGDWPGKPLPFIETLGEEENRCEWEVRIKFSQDNEANVSGNFYGTRKQ